MAVTCRRTAPITYDPSCIEWPTSPTSCQDGFCSPCETAVLDRIPDHRDSVLSAADHAANKVTMVCVSGCKSARLVLDA